MKNLICATVVVLLGVNVSYAGEALDSLKTIVPPLVLSETNLAGTPKTPVFGNDSSKWQEMFVCKNASGARTVIDAGSVPVSHGFTSAAYQLVVRDTELVNLFKEKGVVYPANEKGEIVIPLGDNVIFKDGGRQVDAILYPRADNNVAYRLTVALDALPGAEMRLVQVRPVSHEEVKPVLDWGFTGCAVR